MVKRIFIGKIACLLVCMYIRFYFPTCDCVTVYVYIIIWFNVINNYNHHNHHQKTVWFMWIHVSNAENSFLFFCFSSHLFFFRIGVCGVRYLLQFYYHRIERVFSNEDGAFSSPLREGWMALKLCIWWWWFVYIYICSIAKKKILRMRWHMVTK